MSMWTQYSLGVSLIRSLVPVVPRTTLLVEITCRVKTLKQVEDDFSMPGIKDACNIFICINY